MRSPCAARSVCITASLALKSTEGSSACSWLIRSPRAVAVCVPLKITPRLFLNPRCIASSSDKSSGCADTSPVATLPWKLCAVGAVGLRLDLRRQSLRTSTGSAPAAQGPPPAGRRHSKTSHCSLSRLRTSELVVESRQGFSARKMFALQWMPKPASRVLNVVYRTAGKAIVVRNTSFARRPEGPPASQALLLGERFQASENQRQLPRGRRLNQLRSQRAKPLAKELAHRIRAPSRSSRSAMRRQHRCRLRRGESRHRAQHKHHPQLRRQAGQPVPHPVAVRPRHHRFQFLAARRPPHPDRHPRYRCSRAPRLRAQPDMPGSRSSRTSIAAAHRARRLLMRACTSILTG